MTKSPAEAASEYAYDLHARTGPLSVFDHKGLREIFLAGVQWARANESAELTALIAAAQAINAYGRSVVPAHARYNFEAALAAYAAKQSGGSGGT